MRKIILLSLALFCWIILLLSMMIYFGSNLKEIDLLFHQVIFLVIGVFFYMVILITPLVIFMLWLDKKGLL